ncbi:pilus assembly protein TadG-related protein [Streptomyces sp. NRRL S-340]|uniref:pilus assembly protein TadG-related protein n=1 Tax=Streptomyces sp. NRRL S-340 TaxID=1463901 RepID=UPI00056219F6|nr:pilus assembly protein TadG-related protein [Streptomyces sp. NRRL S-340]
MTHLRRCGDAGQAFPIYITVVAGLLFLGLAYFAVGQATVNRSGAQTAADAAALAAAQDTRDQLAAEWLKDVADPDEWQRIFDGNGDGLEPSCWRAYELAQRNDAQVNDCVQSGPLSYTVDVETNKAMGKSVVPITESKHSKAHATAVIERLCTFDPLPAGTDRSALPRLVCKNNRYWDLDPKDVTDVPRPQDLFDVHLAD